MTDIRETPEFKRARKALDKIAEFIPQPKQRASAIGNAISAARDLVDLIDGRELCLPCVKDGKCAKRQPSCRAQEKSNGRV